MRELDFTITSIVPKIPRERFELLYKSLHMTLENLENRKRAEGGSEKKARLIFNRTKTVGQTIEEIQRQLEAIKNLLTKKELGEFWGKMTEPQQEEFIQIWNEMFDDLATKPTITEPEKKKRIGQIQKSLDKIVAIVNSDPSLQREMGMAIIDTANKAWPETVTNAENKEPYESYELMRALHFIGRLSKSLEELSEKSWLMTHINYPRHVMQEDSVVRQLTMRRMTPFLYSLYGDDAHAKSTEILNSIFPDLKIKREDVIKLPK